MFGLRVRGQCTRTTGRRGGAVGVKKTGKPLPAGGGGSPSTASTAAVGVTSPTPSAESGPKAPTGTPKEAPKK
jgi:small subunit ribosomal protein S13